MFEHGYQSGMSISQDHSHPLLACLDDVSRSIRSVDHVQPVYLSPSVRAEVLAKIAVLKAQTAELELRTIAASDDLGEQMGARDAGAWLTRTTLVDRRAAHGAVKLAKALDEKYVRVAEAMRTGVVNRAQAAVIVHALDALPDGVDAVTRRRAERDLIGFAAVHDPGQLRQLGERILEVVAPEIAEEAEARAVEREEQRAQIKLSLRVRDRGDGTDVVNAILPHAVTARLLTYVDALASPRKQPGGSEELDRVPLSRRRGMAFATVLEHLDPARLPAHGGHPTMVMVTTTLESLQKKLSTASITGSFGGDVRISATETRRLACNAKIVPVVLGGKGEILDLGRGRRLFSPAQVRALRVRDKGCVVEGCGMPAAMTEAHHRKQWSKGGETNLDDGVLYCTADHHKAHDPRFRLEVLPNGQHRFHRRT